MIILTASGSLESFVQFITILLLFLFVLVITYVVTRWVSGIQKIQMTGKNMELVETMRISNSKYLQIVRTGFIYIRTFLRISCQMSVFCSYRAGCMYRYFNAYTQYAH